MRGKREQGQATDDDRSSGALRSLTPRRDSDPSGLAVEQVTTGATAGDLKTPLQRRRHQESHTAPCFPSPLETNTDLTGCSQPCSASVCARINRPPIRLDASDKGQGQSDLCD